MIVRLLLIAAIVWVAWMLYRRLNPARPPAGDQQGSQAPANEQMARCEQCGVHAPESTGVRYQNLFFCSAAHFEDWRRQNESGR
jgi:uncharacterized protein